MTTLSPTFTFSSHDLLEKLRQSSAGTLTGQWRLGFQGSVPPLYIVLSQGKVVFSGSQPIAWTPFITALQRYVPSLRTSDGRKALQDLVRPLLPEQLERLGAMLGKMEKSGLLSYDEAVQAIRLKFLVDFDSLLAQSGEAIFTIDFSLVAQSPILGFELDDLLNEVAQRYAMWQQLRTYIPSLDAVPTVISAGLPESKLSEGQRQQLQKLASLKKDIRAIAELLGKDPIDVAKTFAAWVKSGVVEFVRADGSAFNSAGNLSPKRVFIVDDSPVVIRQFQTLVSRLGYKVAHSEDALYAIERMLIAKPDVIFLDINMPGATGFELIKKIRRQPDLDSVPLVLLTAEKTVSNQWRAQWANCKFLAKPSNSTEQATFLSDLQTLLQEVAPLTNA